MKVPNLLISNCFKKENKSRRILLFIFFLLFFSGNYITAQSSPELKFDWLRNARIFILHAYTYPFTPRIVFDAEKLAETMVDMHVNTLRIATSGHCNWLIPGTEFATASDLGNRDILAECIAACKPRGIRVVPYLRTGGEIPTEIMKPEWAHWLNPSGDIYSRRSIGTLASPLCWNTQYRKAFLDLVKKIVSEYDIDGIYFDAWASCYGFPSPMVCYCPGCRNGFKEAEGLELPYKKNVKDYTPEELETIERYHKWYKEKLAEVFFETKRIIKSKKDIPLIYNVGHASSVAGEDRRIMDGSDAFLYERGVSMLERAEGTSLAVSHGLAVWPYVGIYDGYPRIVHYKYGLQQEIYTTIAFCGSPILYHCYSFVDHPEGRKPVKEAFRLFDENKKYIEKFNPYKFAAVVWNAKDPPRHAVDGWLWDTNARYCTLGAFAACIDNHIQTTSFLKEDLNNAELLNQYEVLYLPDICYLSDEQIANIKKFVRKGGGLVMTYATSLYDKNGKKRPDFALGELAKIQYIEPDRKMSEKMAENLTFGSVWDLYIKTKPGQPVIKSPLSDGLIPTHLYETVKSLPGGTVAADLVIGTNNEPIFPGLVISRYGKGKVAYIPSALDAMYLQTHIKQFSDFIKDVIEYVSPDGQPYEIDAPSSLIANMTSKGDTRVIHLINLTGCNIGKIQQNVYYIPPVENVTIKYKIPNGKKIKKIGLFVPAEFSQYSKGNILYITFPRVEKYQGVIIEME